MSAPWSGVRGRTGCGWCGSISAPGAAGSQTLLLLALAVPADELSAMGRRGRAWMARDFGWTRVAADMAELYAWLLHGGEPPPTVRLT